MKNRRSTGTKERILRVAQKLFFEKGYDNTSIQDIIDGLGGMTKGVIYHYFSSKQDILQGVLDSVNYRENELAKKDEKVQDKTGLEKMQYHLAASVRSLRKLGILYSAKAMRKSPRIIGEMYLACMFDKARHIQPYFDEGIEDGSIVTNYPKELAEFTFLTLNVWMGINIIDFSREELERKLFFIRDTFLSLNVPIINDEIIQSFFDIYDFLHKNKKK